MFFSRIASGVAIQTLILSLVFQKASGYQDLIKDQDQRCSQCHLSPSGGGLLNQAGVLYSKTRLPFWTESADAEIDPKNKKWFWLGGNLRGLFTQTQSYANSHQEFIPVQADLEGAVQIGPLLLDMTLGGLRKNQHIKEVGSRRYYLLYQITPFLAARMGRFIPIFGINTPDYFLPNREGLNFGQGKEYNAFEISWEADGSSVFLSSQRQPGEISDSERESAQSIKFTQFFSENLHIGTSFWRGKTLLYDRDIFGLDGVYYLFPNHSLIADFSYQLQKDLITEKTARGIFYFFKYSYEIKRGVKLFYLQDEKISDVDYIAQRQLSFGIGSSLFLKHHFEFQGLYRKVRDYSEGSEFQNFIYLMIHYFF